MNSPVFYGITNRKGYHDCRHRRLTPGQVREMRALWADGLHNCHELARRFACDRKTVKSIVRGQSWRKMPNPTLWDVF